MDPQTRRFAGVPHRPGVRIQNSFTTADLGQDLVNAGGPDEGFRADIVLCKVFMDRALQVGYVRKAAATNPLLVELSKPAVGEI